MSKLIIYGRPNCDGCNKSKTLLKVREVEYEYVDITEGRGSIAFYSDFPDAKSVPQIIRDDGYVIGGFRDLVAYLENPT